MQGVVPDAIPACPCRTSRQVSTLTLQPFASTVAISLRALPLPSNPECHNATRSNATCKAGLGLRAPHHRRRVWHVSALPAGDGLSALLPSTQPVYVRADQRVQVCDEWGVGAHCLCNSCSHQGVCGRSIKAIAAALFLLINSGVSQLFCCSLLTRDDVFCSCVLGMAIRGRLSASHEHLFESTVV